MKSKRYAQCVSEPGWLSCKKLANNPTQAAAFTGSHPLPSPPIGLSYLNLR